MKINVAMLGSRNHYVIPIILSKNNLLNIFYTDSYIGNKPILKQILKSLSKISNSRYIKKYLTRENLDINPKKVKSYELLGIKYAFLRKRSKNYEEMENVFARINSEFCLKVIEDAEKHSGSFNAFYGFNGASLEIIEFARRNNVKFILEQTLIPHRIEYEILNNEIEKYKGFEKNETIRNLNSKLVNREIREIELADYIIVPSQFVLDNVKRLGIDDKKLILIHYGVDMSRYSYKIRKISKNEPLKVLYAGEVGLRKGAIYLLEALKKIGSKTVKVKFAGGISFKEEVLKKYEEIADFLGHIPKSEMYQFFNWADVFILPSLAEGSAVSIYEALASGLPVITTPNSGSIVEHMKTGIIVPVRDVYKIAEAIQLYIQNPDLLEEHSKNAIAMREYIDISRYELDILEFLKNKFNERI